MPGRPMEIKMWADIDAMGGLEGVLRRVADGASMTELAQELGVSRSFLSWKLNDKPGMSDALKRARASRADKWAEEALTLADGVREDPNAINKAKTQIDVRKWLAGVDDPERYGTQKPSVTISIGSLHLDALRKVQAEVIEGVVLDADAD